MSPRTVAESCTCNLEPSFSACSGADSGYEAHPGDWVIIDAECEEIARCPNEKYARLIVWSLDKQADNKDLIVCRVHGVKESP